MIQNEAALINAGLQIGLYDRELVNRLRGMARVNRVPLIDVISRELGLPRTAFYLALAEAHVLPFARLDQWTIDTNLLSRLPPSLLKRHLMAPMRDGAGTLHLAVNDPSDHTSVETARRVVGNEAPLAVAEPDALAPLVAHLLGSEVRELIADDPFALFDRFLRDALLRRASDLHL